MSIVAMKKLRLIAVRSQQEEILRELMLLGCVQISEPEELPEGLVDKLKRNDSGELFHDRQKLQKLQSALDVLDEYAKAKKCCNRAYAALQGTKSDELSAVYKRVKKESGTDY